MREVLTYSRRGSRFTPRQAEAWAAHQADWVIPDEAVDRPGLLAGRAVRSRGAADPRDRVRASARRPPSSPPRAPTTTCWRSRSGCPGVADSLWRVAEAGADNVRFCSVDAVWSLEHLLAPASLAEIWTFFPDPWRKTKHRKRRLVNPANAALASSRLVPGRRVAAGDGLGRLRRPDARRARRRADPRGRPRRALGRAPGDPLRAQGPRRRPRHRRLLLPPQLGAEDCARRVEEGELLVDVGVVLAERVELGLERELHLRGPGRPRRGGAATSRPSTARPGCGPGRRSARGRRAPPRRPRALPRGRRRRRAPSPMLLRSEASQSRAAGSVAARARTSAA